MALRARRKGTGSYAAGAHAAPSGPCPFCEDALAASSSPFDTILAEGSDLRLIPALGMLVPGYMLATTREHVLSMAQLGRPRLQSVMTWTQEVIDMLAPHFGDYFVFEHGSCAADAAGACIDHAHTHLIPLSERLTDDVLDPLPWRPLSRYTDLADYASMSYLYFSSGERQFILPQPAVGSQWIRRIIAQCLGHDLWDWAVDPGAPQLVDTLSAFEGLLAPPNVS